MSDDKLDDLLRLARDEYNDPPETPRDALWRRIQQERSGAASPESSRDRQARRKLGGPLSRWFGRGFVWQITFATAAAATLLIVLWGRNEPTPAPERGVQSLQQRIRETQRPKGAAAAYEAVATSHLTRTDALLTTLRQDAKDPESRKALTDWARELLAETRLLMDSPAGRDEELRPLLLDVELALAEVARLEADDPAEQRRVEEGMDERALLGRVRFKTKAATVSVGI